MLKSLIGQDPGQSRWKMSRERLSSFVGLGGSGARFRIRPSLLIISSHNYHIMVNMPWKFRARDSLYVGYMPKYFLLIRILFPCRVTYISLSHPRTPVYSFIFRSRSMPLRDGEFSCYRGQEYACSDHCLAPAPVANFPIYMLANPPIPVSSHDYD